MKTENAIARVRFASAKAQVLSLHDGDTLGVTLVCLEPGQEHAGSGPAVCYVITGSATLSAGAAGQTVRAGGVATFEPAEDHVIANRSEGRVVCLVLRTSA